jgi:hypothetical protein
MKLPVIKSIIEQYSLEELKAAEHQLMEGETLKFEIAGDDEGEQLTHVLAAIWIKEEMEKTGSDPSTALRAYTSRVRQSIN